MSTIEVKTETGTKYLIRRTGDVSEVQRLGGYDMRGDGRWLKAFVTPTPVIGQPMVFVVEGLGELPFTERTTTPVVSIKEKK